MSSWYEEKPSQEFRKRVEHRAFQMIDNMENQTTQTEVAARRASWSSWFQVAAGLSVATLIGVLLARRNDDPSETGSEFGHLISDSLAMDLLEESTQSPAVHQASNRGVVDLDLLADLELLESFDDLSEISEDDLTEEKV